MGEVVVVLVVVVASLVVIVVVVIVVGLKVLIIVGFGDDDDVINITNTIVEVVSNIYTNNMIKPIASDFILSLNDTVYIF